MVTVYDVSPQPLLERVAEKLRKEVKVPEFLYYVKTGAHRERPPDDPERFWYLRLASILRRAYVDGVVGVNKLARHYGGRKNRGVKPEHFHPAGRKIIRVALQELEKVGYLQKGQNGKGRVLTPKGQSLIDNAAYEVWQSLTSPKAAEKPKPEKESKAAKAKPKAKAKKEAKEKKEEQGEKAKKKTKTKGRRRKRLRRRPRRQRRRRRNEPSPGRAAAPAGPHAFLLPLHFGGGGLQQGLQPLRYGQGRG